MTKEKNTKNHVLIKGFFLMLMISSLSLSAFAQSTHLETVKRIDAERNQRAAMQAAIEDSESAKQLKLLVDSGNYKAILAAAETRDPTLLPYLRILASDKEKRMRRQSAAFYAHVALAKFAESGTFDEILSELARKDNRWIREAAIFKLALIGSKESFRLLLALLDDHSYIPSEAIDLPAISVSRTVMSSLAQTVDCPPESSMRFSVDAWKAWFERNRHLID